MRSHGKRQRDAFMLQSYRSYLLEMRRESPGAARRMKRRIIRAGLLGR